MSIHDAYELQRSAIIIRALSASPADWISPSVTDSLIPSNTAAEFRLSPGLTVTLFFLVQLALIRRSIQPIKQLAVWTGLAVFLSFGGNLRWYQLSLWQCMCDIVPMLSSVRSPYRFAYFAQTGMILLVCYQLEHVWKYANRLPSSFTHPIDTQHTNPHVRYKQRFIAGLLIAICSTIAWQATPARTFLFYPPLPQHEIAWANKLDELADMDDPVLCLPVAQNISEFAQQREAIWMLHQIHHRRPLLNGYSGFSPPSWQLLSKELRGEVLDQQRLAVCRQSQAKWIVIRHDLMPIATPVLEDCRRKGQIAFRDARATILQMTPPPTRSKTE